MFILTKESNMDCDDQFDFEVDDEMMEFIEEVVEEEDK